MTIATSVLSQFFPKVPATLEEFHQMLTAFRTHGGPPSNEVIYVAGCWRIGGDGSAALITLGGDWPVQGRYPDVPLLTRKLEGYLQEQGCSGWIYHVACSLPTPEAVCSVCGKGWTMENIHDVTTPSLDSCRPWTQKIIGDAPGDFPLRHQSCLRGLIQEAAHHYFQNMATQAGFPSDAVYASKGHSCGCASCPSQFELATPYGVLMVRRWYDTGYSVRVDAPLGLNISHLFRDGAGTDGYVHSDEELQHIFDMAQQG